MPKELAADMKRRKKTKVPEDVVFRTKPEIDLGQVKRALGNVIRFESLTFDEFYGRSRSFLDVLRDLDTPIWYSKVKQIYETVLGVKEF